MSTVAVHKHKIKQKTRPLHTKKLSKRPSLLKKKTKPSPFADAPDDSLRRAFQSIPKDQVSPCRYFCEQAYKFSPYGPFPPECGYQRLTDKKTGRLYYDDSPQNRGCLSAGEVEGFELESATACTVWNRSFTRQQILTMLKPYMAKPNELVFMTKKELCGLLSQKANEVYYELETIATNWCSQLQEELDKPEMMQVFALLRLPPPATYFYKREACAALLKKIAEMRPPWYSRLWRYVGQTTQNVLDWVSQNPTKTLLLAASLISSIYYAPQVAQQANQVYQQVNQNYKMAFANLYNKIIN